MFRGTSASGFGLVALGAFLVFLPLAAASERPTQQQTLTVTALAAALAAVGLIWMVFSPRGLVRPVYGALAALAGAVTAGWFAASGPAADMVAMSGRELGSALLRDGLLYAAGVWIWVIGLRRVFPRPNRLLGGSAIALVVVGLLLWPSLLLQPDVQRHRISDVVLQLRAGYRYWTIGFAILVAPFFVLATIPGDWFERWWKQAVDAVGRISPRAFAMALIATTFTIALILSIYSFDRRPTTADEIAQLWHARMLLSGRLAMPPDPNPEFFAIDNIVDRPEWMSQFPIGGPAVLAVGLLVGAAWIVNPILTALTAWNVYRFAQRAYGEPQARAAGVVVATSPMLMIMGATHMNHTPTAWLVTMALAALPVWFLESGKRAVWRAAAIIGASIGLAATIRPLDGAVAAVVFALPALLAAIRDRMRARSLLVAVAAGSLPIALLLIANAATTGHPFRFGYEVLWGANHSLGLHDDPTGVPHTPWRALLLVVKYAAQTNWIVTGWPLPVLLVVTGGLIASRRANRWDALLLTFFCAQLVTYGFYWHDGQFVGPRFLFTAIPALLILAARAPFILADRLRSGTQWRIAMVALPACIGVTWLHSMRPYGIQGLAAEFRESRSRLKVDAPARIANGELRNVLVFVQEGASSRLLHRMWGLGVSRPDAARIFARADACSLADAILIEEAIGVRDTAGRAQRIERAIRPFRRSQANLALPDMTFRVTDSTSVTPACAREVAHDYRVKNTVAFGPMLLLNRFDANGRLAGDAIYAMDLGDHNEALRQRFANRAWFRYEVPRVGAETEPILVPYDSGR